MKLSDRFANLIKNNPKTCILVSTLFIFIAVLGLPKIQADFSIKNWFKSEDNYLQEFNQFKKKFGSDDSFMILIHNKNGIFNKKTISTIQEVTEKAWLIQDVIRVDSIANYNYAESIENDIVVDPFILEDEELTKEYLLERSKKIQGNKDVENYLISKDQKTAIIYGILKPYFEKERDHFSLVDEVNKLVDQYKGSELEIFLVGVSPIAVAQKNLVMEDISIIVPLLLLIVSIILFIIFRSIPIILISISMIIVTVLSVIGIAGWFDLKYSIVSSMLPNILLAICLADAIHLISSFTGFRQQGLSKLDSCFKAIKKNLKPTSLTTISTSIGFFSLLTTDLVPIRDLGLMAGIGTIIAWFLTLFFLMPVLIYLPSFSVKKRVRSNLHLFSFLESEKYINFLQNRKMLIIFSSLIIFISSIYLATMNHVNSESLDNFKDDVEIKQATQFMEKNVGGIKVIEIIIDSEKIDGIKDPVFLNKVSNFQDWLLKRENVTSVNSMLNIIKQMNKAVNNNQQEFYTIPTNKKTIAENLFLYTMSLPPGMGLNYWQTVDNKELRLSARLVIKGSKYVIEEIKHIKNKINEMGLNGTVTGKTNLVVGVTGYIVKTFFSSMTMAILLISLLMSFIFKSIKMGLISMIPNIIPPFIGLAYAYLAGISIDIGTVIVTSVCLGITVDDTIYFLSDYSESIKKGSNSQRAIKEVFSHTGKALIYTTLILCIGFLTFSFGNFKPNIHFGQLTALVLLIALLTDLIVLPAILIKKEKP